MQTIPFRCSFLCCTRIFFPSSTFLLLLLLSLLLFRLSPAEASGEADCPFLYEDVQSWCEKVFGREGTVTAGRWDTREFQCVCNGATTVSIYIGNMNSNGNYRCTWDDPFEEYPGGDYCYTTTGVCPAECSDISLDLCDTKPTLVPCVPYMGDGYNYTCSTCSGRIFSMIGNETNCTKEYTLAPTGCDPATTCNGHGCCNPYATDSNAIPKCTCYDDDVNGHWDGTSCNTCKSPYDGNRNPPCVTETPRIQVLFASIAETWTMVFPNLAVVFLITMWILFRRMWHSDSTFDLTELRRANLMPTQIARRRQQSLFRSKYIPQRPAKSRCFLNDNLPSVGAPAY